jgi:hypothetical protein
MPAHVWIYGEAFDIKPSYHNYGDFGISYDEFNVEQFSQG